MAPASFEVASLPAKGKVERLTKMFRGRQRALVLTHDNPDPDSMAAAWALATVLSDRVGVPADIAYGGIIGRAENAAFVKTLKIPINHVEDVDMSGYDLFAIVDTQQGVGNHALPESTLADIVVDHHPVREEEGTNPFGDVGGEYGATSTMLTEYVRAARIEPSPELATALYYGIKADTRDLGRQTSDPDVDCYLWLFPRIDRELLSQIEHPKLPVRYFRLFHAAIEKARIYSQAVITDLGDVYSPDLVAEVAERLSFIEDTKWSLAFGSYRSQLFLSLRVSDRRMNAGRLIRETCASFGGSAGGHGSMAGARLPLAGRKAQREAFKRELVRRFKEAFGVEGERGASLLSDEA
ncbi:MAG: bifunctional oligoribonuclease/PAP phosphatase NrnA [Archangium sp.]|nr:bifunctional oligoribonuclease/PAP phosphatase NrnA [Archangium sp.]MDP3573725.1 bifunctional oligoribonuclease/PAP phosphatase NrnA [Archangium sp.]